MGLHTKISVDQRNQQELGARDKEMITVFNKIDAYKDESENPLSLEEFKNTWMAKHNSPAIFISAQDRINIDNLRKEIYERAKAIHLSRYPYDGLLYNMDYVEEQE